jgi:Na+-driven multidrug efflux pump
LVTFAFLVFEVINIGTSVLCAQYLGAKLQRKMVQVVGVALLLNIVIGALISALLHFGAAALLHMMGLREQLMELGVSYMRIVGAFAFFQALSFTVSASLRSAGKANYPMMVTVVVNILNIVGNYALIFGKLGMPALGVEGAAISTAFARGVSMVILFVILFCKHIQKFPLEYFRPFPFLELKNLLKIGLPSAGENMSYSLSHLYGEHRDVRLPLRHLHGSERRHLHRQPGGAEEGACRLLAGQVCDACVDTCVRDAVVHLGDGR